MNFPGFQSTSIPDASSPPNDAEIERARQIVNNIAARYSRIMVGQSELLTCLLTTVIARGHILLESVPGLAKTTAAKTLADCVQASFTRVQCTPDLLPSDIIGTQVFDYQKSTFETRLGPVHANIVLLDEINRSSAKTQSAMLEAMQERQTTIGGQVYQLPEPFFVLATQNPIEQEGTYVLPEAQMDRFLLKEVLTYPAPEEEAEVLRRIDTGALGTGKTTFPPAATVQDVLYLQQISQRIYLDESIRSYIVSIVQSTRSATEAIGDDLGRYVQYGASPRAAIAFQVVARALAVLEGRNHVIPEDVKKLRHQILRHRLILSFDAVVDDVEVTQIIDRLFECVRVP